MPAQNKLIDYVTPLDWEVYRENVARRTYEFPVSYTLPGAITTRATYDAAGMRPLPANLQPTVTLVGRLMTHTYANTKDLPQAFFQEILFDGRIVLAGNVTVGKRTAFLGTPENGTIIIQTAPNVTVVVPFSGDFATILFRDQAQAAAGASATSATNAAASAVTANQRAVDAAASAGTATTQAGNATTQATNAAASAVTATQRAVDAAASANTATTQAVTATTQATNAGTQATNAAGSAVTATQQAGIATTQATNASNSAASALASQQYVYDATGKLVVFVSEDAESVRLAFGNLVSIVDFPAVQFPYVAISI